MSKKGKEVLAVGIFLYIVIGLFWGQTIDLPTDSRIVPRGILILLFALNTANVITDIRKFSHDNNAECNFTAQKIVFPCIILTVIGLYILLFSIIGYLPATIIMVAGLLIYAKVRPAWLIAAISGGFAVFVYILFDVLLSVSVF